MPVPRRGGGRIVIGKLSPRGGRPRRRSAGKPLKSASAVPIIVPEARGQLSCGNRFDIQLDFTVERAEQLGGAALQYVKKEEVRAYVKDLAGEVSGRDDIEVLTGSELTHVSGFIGNYESTVRTPSGEKTVSHGIAILATGGRPADTDEYLYHKSDRVTRWHDLWDHPSLPDADSIVFIQCVGSRCEERPYCSKICCTASIESAIRLKEEKPERQVYILYRDIRTYGDKERLYQQARQLGVMFIRYSPENPPAVKEAGGGLEVTVFEPVLGRDVVIAADLVNLATAIEPGDHTDAARQFKVSENAEHFLAEAHAKLRPVDCATDGVFICGLAHYPKFMEESLAQAQAAASRAATVLSSDRIAIEPIVSEVNEELCIGCGLCESVCPYGAIRLKPVEGAGYVAENLSALCKGCGICAAGCPQQAIDMRHFRNEQIRAAVAAGL